tara:strand:+ start:96 stop:296 length:201 start_codon:yes stop_codon:yes gene_type:complete
MTYMKKIAASCGPLKKKKKGKGLKSACWSGYEAIGMKNKGGKKVPNCVPIKGKKKKSPAKAHCFKK